MQRIWAVDSLLCNVRLYTCNVRLYTCKVRKYSV